MSQKTDLMMNRNAFQRKKMNLPDCPVETTLLFLSDKEKVLIVGYLLDGPLRPSVLQKKIGSISKNVMNSRLRELEEMNLIQRKIYEEVPPKVEYFLTDMGYSMKNVIDAMEEWGITYKNLIKS